MERMYLIYTTPWGSHKTLADYGNFLKRQHILPHFARGSREVHQLFDDQGRLKTPKQYEHARRDAGSQLESNHICHAFAPELLIPKKWNEDVLRCRTCKRSLVTFLSQFFIDNISSDLQVGQKFITAGGFTDSRRGQAILVQHQSSPNEEHSLACNAEEADTRIWVHVIHAGGSTRLVVSPDTDVYHIGLPIIAQYMELDVKMQISKINSKELRILDIKSLLQAFYNNPDLAHISQSTIPTVMQMFVSTGCFFVSFFHGFGKASFLKTFYRHTTFITSGLGTIPGVLSDMSLSATAGGALAFIRLVGCTYFEKHRSGFTPAYPTPEAHFNSLFKEDQTVAEHHEKWMHDIRNRIWSRIQFEEDMVPSNDTLRRHWRRTCWVGQMWAQAVQHRMDLPPLEGNGWTQCGSQLKVDWDSSSNIEMVKRRVSLMKKGCNCRASGCQNLRCGCKRRKSQCGPSCNCINCCNMPSTLSENPLQLSQQVSPSDTAVLSLIEEEQAVADEDTLLIMKQVFGEDYINDHTTGDDVASSTTSEDELTESEFN